MLRHYFENISGINMYAIFSLLIFFLFFVGVAAYLVKTDKSHMREMSNKPLESSEFNNGSINI